MTTDKQKDAMPTIEETLDELDSTTGMLGQLGLGAYAIPVNKQAEKLRVKIDDEKGEQHDK